MWSTTDAFSADVPRELGIVSVLASWSTRIVDGPLDGRSRTTTRMPLRSDWEAAELLIVGAAPEVHTNKIAFLRWNMAP